MKFLRDNKQLVFPESTSEQIAEKVSRGCDGAAGTLFAYSAVFKVDWPLRPPRSENGARVFGTNARSAEKFS